MAYGDLKVRNLIWNTGSGDNTVVLNTLATTSSPTFTGTVTVPTATAGDNSTKAASTAFVVASFAPKANPTFTGTVNGADLVLSGNLTVNGTQTIINTQTLDVEDKQIEIGKVSSPSDTTADQGGWKLKGATDKTFLWVNATDAWTSSEHIHLGDNKKLLVGNGSDLQIYHDGSNSKISDVGTGDLQLLGANVGIYSNAGEAMFVGVADGAVELYYDNAKKIETASFGTQFYGILYGGDNAPIYLGSSNDLQIYHDGNNSAINHNGTGDFYIQSNNNLYIRNFGGDNYIRAIKDGSVELYYDNVKKLETSSAGVTVTGTLAATAVTGDGSGLTNLPPGGNTFTAVADGAIATNKCVKLKTNGKVEEIAQVITGGNPADDNSVENCSSTTTTNVSLVYDPDQDKIICYYTSSYANDNMKYSVMSINSQGRAQGFSGSDTGIESSIKVNGGYEWGTACYDTHNNKHIWAGRCRNDDNVYVGVGTYNTSNNTITWPSGKSNYSQPNGANNNARIPTLYFDDTTNRIVCLLRDDTNSDRPYVVIGSYNSSSGGIDWGTKQQLDTTDIRDNNTIVCKGGSGTGEVFVGYKSSYTALKGNLITVSNSSNTCTIQSSNTIENSASEFRAAYNAEDNNILLAYQDQNNNQGKLIRLTKNSGGTGFDKTSALTFCVNDQASRWDVVYNTSGKQCYVFFRLSFSNNRLNAFRVTNTSGTPTKSSNVQGRYDSTLTNSAKIGICMANRNTDTTNDKLYAAFIYSGNDKAYIETWACLSATSNQTSSTKHQYVGFVDQAYSDGQTATIITYGNTKSGLSGLTTGSKYFVNGNGNLSTGDQGLGHAGLALAADKLLIKEPEI